MDFKTTSIETSPKRAQGGFTLVEFMISTAVGSIVLAAVASLMFYTGRSFSAMANYVDLDYHSRMALDEISRDVRQAARAMEVSDTHLVLEDSSGGQIRYLWNADAKTLTRTRGTETKELLSECVSLKFSPFQRNPRTGVYDQYPSATPDTCKLIQIHWICRRTTLGTIINTESVQSAKVVIRKQ